MVENRKFVFAHVIPDLGSVCIERLLSELIGYLCKESDLAVYLVLYGK